MTVLRYAFAVVLVPVGFLVAFLTVELPFLPLSTSLIALYRIRLGDTVAPFTFLTAVSCGLVAFVVWGWHINDTAAQLAYLVLLTGIGCAILVAGIQIRRRTVTASRVAMPPPPPLNELNRD